MSGTFPCPNCGKPVPDEADACPNCQFYFGPSDAAPPPPPPEPEEVVEVVDGPPAEYDAWGGQLDDVQETTYDLERERDRIAGEGGPDWESFDRAMGVDLTKEVRIVRDAPPAGLVRRFIAWSIDLVITELPVIAGVLLAKFAFGASDEALIVFGGAAAVVCFVPITIWRGLKLHETNGQTFGKNFVGIEVVQLSGMYMDADQSRKRAFWSVLVPVFFITAPFDLQKRAIHDLLAKTRVIRS